MLVPKANKDLMVLLESLEMMVPLEIQDDRDHQVIMVVMPLSKIALDAHQPVPPKAIKALLVKKETLVTVAIVVDQVLLVSLVDVFLVNLESLEKMVNQVTMESMVNLVKKVRMENLEMMLALRSLPVQVTSLV